MRRCKREGVLEGCHATVPCAWALCKPLLAALHLVSKSTQAGFQLEAPAAEIICPSLGVRLGQYISQWAVLAGRTGPACFRQAPPPKRRASRCGALRAAYGRPRRSTRRTRAAEACVDERARRACRRRDSLLYSRLLRHRVAALHTPVTDYSVIRTVGGVRKLDGPREQSVL